MTCCTGITISFTIKARIVTINTLFTNYRRFHITFRLFNASYVIISEETLCTCCTMLIRWRKYIWASFTVLDHTVFLTCPSWSNSCLSSMHSTVILTRSTPNFSSTVSDTVHMESRSGNTWCFIILISPACSLCCVSIPRGITRWGTCH
jgi:hypothetical protein